MNDNLIPVCSLLIWRLLLCCLKDFERVLKASPVVSVVENAIVDPLVEAERLAKGLKEPVSGETK